MATSLPKSKQWKLGTLAILPYDIDVAHNATVAGTLAVTGVATFTAAPVFTAAFASKVPVQTIAAAGSTVSDAAQLIAGLNIVTGANGTLGVVLPATPVAGTIVYIKGTTSGTLKIWPDAAATINAVGSNGAYTTATVAPTILIASSATQWYTFPLVAS